MEPRSIESEPPRVIFEDARWLVLEKPAWLATTSPDETEATLARWARERAKHAEIVHPTSRLDVGVTGVCVVALTREANAAALDARSRGGYSRTYVALASATDVITRGASGVWDRAIAVHPQDPKRRVAVAPGKKARPPIAEARTEWRAIDVLAGVVLLAMHPVTGRTHQLRVHAAAAGMALLGDAAYGGARRRTLANGSVIAMRRPALHCARVRIEVGGAIGVLDVSSDVPGDLRETWRALGGEDDAWSRAVAEGAG